MYFKCTCGVGSSIKLKYDWLMCSGLTFRENTKCFLNTLQNHFDDPYCFIISLKGLNFCNAIL